MARRRAARRRAAAAVVALSAAWLCAAGAGHRGTRRAGGPCLAGSGRSSSRPNVVLKSVEVVLAQVGAQIRRATASAERVQAQVFAQIAGFFTGPFLEFGAHIGDFFSGPFLEFGASIGRLVTGLVFASGRFFTGAVFSVGRGCREFGVFFTRNLAFNIVAVNMVAILSVYLAIRRLLS
ncbi:unnamed protein product [Prorocentrum cordatum]|uniref:Uncharacterized protein n=1 Tax=Prorocentrum cordatum TaxID=2364126 RepID=A0ABN9VE72_9DINO|nr:unnamed protein product [Polarella glacialis]